MVNLIEFIDKVNKTSWHGLEPKEVRNPKTGDLVDLSTRQVEGKRIVGVIFETNGDVLLCYKNAPSTLAEVATFLETAPPDDIDDFIAKAKADAPRTCNHCDYFSGNTVAPGVRPAWCTHPDLAGVKVDEDDPACVRFPEEQDEVRS